MFQLTYTSCRPGMSLNGAGGYTVRAASLGLEQRWLSQAPHLARCDMTSNLAESGPVRLAFHRQDDAVVVGHTVCTVDHDMRVASFTHALLDPTGRLTASEAIAAWDSHFWRRANDDGSSELPPVNFLPSGPTLNWNSVATRLQQPTFSAMACFAMSAWLRSQELPILLLAESDAVAAVIWILTRALPGSLLKSFSFATNDPDPGTARVSLVGYRSTKTLPAEAMATWRWFNAANGARKEKDFLEAYAEFVIQQAAAGDGHAVDLFVTQSEELDVETADQIDLLYRVIHESYVCTEADLLSVQCCPKLLRWLLEDSRHARVAVGLVERLQMTDPQANAGLASIFRERPERVDALVAAILSRAARELQTGNGCAAQSCIDLCARTDSHIPIATFWRRLTEHLDCTTLRTDMRALLAAQIHRKDASADTQMIVQQLLSVCPEALPELLCLPIDASLKATACRNAVEQSGSLCPAACKALCRQSDVLRSLLLAAPDPTQIALDIAGHDPAAVIPLLISDKNLRSRIDLDSIVARAAEASPIWIDQLLKPPLSEHWPALLAASQGPRILSQIMAAPLTRYSPAEIGRFLRAAKRVAQVSSSMAGPLERRLQLVAVLSGPTPIGGDLSTIIAAVRELPEVDRQSVFASIVPQCVASVARQTGSAFRDQLGALTEAATMYDADLSVHILRTVAAALCEAGRLLKEPKLGVTLLAYAFGATGEMAFSDAALRDQSVDFGVELIGLYARAGGPALNRSIYEQASRWPEPARSLWRLAGRGQRINGRVRAFLARRRTRTTG